MVERYSTHQHIYYISIFSLVLKYKHEHDQSDNHIEHLTIKQTLPDLLVIYIPRV